MILLANLLAFSSTTTTTSSIQSNLKPDGFSFESQFRKSMPVLGCQLKRSKLVSCLKRGKSNHHQRLLSVTVFQTSDCPTANRIKLTHFAATPGCSQIGKLVLDARLRSLAKCCSIFPDIRANFSITWSMFLA